MLMTILIKHNIKKFFFFDVIIRSFKLYNDSFQVTYKKIFTCLWKVKIRFYKNIITAEILLYFTIVI